MGLRRVTLSIGRYAYTCELLRESETSWKLRKVEVHNVGVVGQIHFKAGSCLEALQQGEIVANEIIAAAGGDQRNPKMNP